MELELDGFFLVGYAGGGSDLSFVFPSSVESGNVGGFGLFGGGEGEEGFSGSGGQLGLGGERWVRVTDEYANISSISAAEGED